MLAASRRSLSLALALILAFTPLLRAQQTTPIAAPVPPQIAAAHKIFVSNGGGSNYFDMFTGGPDRAYNSLYAELQQSNRYQIVSSPADADLIFEIRSIAPAVDASTPDSPGGIAYNPQLILSIQDPATHAVLWTTSANVRAVGTQSRRDREFDQSLEVAVDKLRQVTGEQLTPAQIKAIQTNSRMPTATKVLLIAVIATGVAMLVYGIYRVTHPPTLPPLTQPVFP
jgi:hypothetical protein